MIYDLRKLQEDETKEFKKLIEKYKKYDKVDIIIDMTLQNLGISPFNFNDREIINKKPQKETLPQITQESLKYCDGEKCEIPVFMKNRC